MYESKKQLRRRIEDLKEQLARAENEIDIVEKSGLAKCKGIMCRGCEHAVFIRYFEMDRLIGCDLTTSCENYKKRALSDTHTTT